MALYVYSWGGAVPHVVRGGHATKGYSMSVAIPIWVPKSAFKLIPYLGCNRDNAIEIERFVDKESPEMRVYDYRDQSTRSYTQYTTK